MRLSRSAEVSSFQRTMVGPQKFSTFNLISEEYRKHQTEKEESSFEEPAAHERAVLYGNLSAALKKLDRIEDAIKAAAESLQLESDYLKVRIRRAEVSCSFILLILMLMI